MSSVEQILRRRHRQRTWGRAALVFVVVTWLVWFFGWPHWQQYRARQDAQADRAAMAEYAPVARPAMTALLSYDYRDFDGAVLRGRSHLTGPFDAEWAAALATLRTTALAEQAVVTADVHRVSLRERGQHRSEVRAFVTRSRTTNRLAGVEITNCEVVVALERVGSAWKVAGFVIQPEPAVRISPTAAP